MYYNFLNFVKRHIEIHSLKKLWITKWKIIQVQGDEPYALKELLYKLNYKEDNLVTGFNNNIKLSCKYIFKDKIHVFYIIDENKIIEVKSEYYYNKDFDKNIAKCKCCLELVIYFWILDIWWKKINKL